ncbi:lysylphosphatidylglycerol synthase domain-containing protein [Salipiger sp. 1_MG-2023]|uniref:lysylphosphatidylglycerol synthase domain-containing protein n=1 Tax=Salipiger sp. 1_MG-2023 TaxID=3062665 RepID=UPI0026E2B608|nr:lysylphosphatidylglycerol synthase domain-containing protein [Salipiger sp. 1_MG-2023]MDO6588241.1 lysylphosphatidylglycerol synthase domain-containing protein [Salipiger sp. 1_MG-2023]
MSALSRHAPRLLGLARAGLTLLALLWLVRFVAENALDLRTALIRIEPLAVGLAVAAVLIGLLPGAWAWQRLMARALPTLTPTRGILVYLRSGVGKYTPGGVLAFAIQHRALNDQKASPLCLVKVFAGTALAACFAAAALSLPAMTAVLDLPRLPAVAGVALPVLLVLGLLLWAARHPAWPLCPDRLDQLGIPQPPAFATSVALMTLAWTATGLHLVALGVPLGADPLLLLSAFALSAIVGIVFAVLPGALGVRDGALSLLLASQLSPVDAMALALVSRALIVAADVLGSATATFVAWALTRRAATPQPNPEVTAS